ncbi:MAG: type IV pilus assembly protein PilM [Patescibacteria group bacterium]
MAIFRKKETRFVGVDIGAGGVKLIELLFEDGVYKLMTYGATDRLAEVVDTPLTENAEEAVLHIQKLVKDAGVVGKKVVASLPVHSVFSSVIAIPEVKTEEERRVLVEKQAAKLIPMPLEQMVIDYQIIDGEAEKSGKTVSVPSTGAEKNIRVLITGATRKMVKTYTEIFDKSGMDLESLETEPFALIRSLVGTDRSSIMILDVGAFRTNMTIAEDCVPFVNRSIKVGGAMVTRKIAEQMGVSVAEAEQIKHDLAEGQTDGVPKAVEDLFMPIVNEISYAMKMHAESEWAKQAKVEKVILTGGSAHLPGLDVFLTERLNVRTYVGDPWARIKVHESLRPVLDEIGPRYSVALGLAMHAKKEEKQESIEENERERTKR